jgi:hypothetical protein
MQVAVVEIIGMVFMFHSSMPTALAMDMRMPLMKIAKIAHAHPDA